MPSQNRTQRKTWVGILLVLLILLGAGLLLREFSPSLAPAPVEETPVTVAAVEPAPAAPAPTEEPTPSVAPTAPEEAETAPALPPLNESDPMARELAQAISSSPRFAALLIPGDLIRRFVADVDNVAAGNIPVAEFESLRPKQEFHAALNADDEWIIDPASFARYDSVVKLVVSVSPKHIAAFYTRLRPLCQTAYRELGYPDGDFNQTLEHAIQHLLDTPSTGNEIQLTPRTKRFEFTDPSLEAHSLAQRQLLRMGPENVRKIKGMLRKIRIELGFDN